MKTRAIVSPLTARNDLVANLLTRGVLPTSVTVALLATPGGTCNAAAVGGGQPLAPGLCAWGTTLHALPSSGYGVTEGPFVSSPLSSTQAQKLALYCGFIKANGSGFGVCKACQNGGQ